MYPRRAAVFAVMVLLLGCYASAQESYFGAIFRDEANQIKSGCSRKNVTGTKPLKEFIPGCLQSLVRGNKGLYGSFATLSPQNGFALGAVFKDSELNTTNWRMSYQIDGQGSFNGSWTAGGFLQMERAPSRSDLPTPVAVAGPPPKHLDDLSRTEGLVLNFYAFHTSLQKVNYYGIGSTSTVADRAFFTFAETITGVQADYPLKYGFHLLGEVNGRWPQIGGRHGDSSPSIEQLYSEATAPGLTQQPGFLQLGEAVRYSNNFRGRAALDYGVKFQQFFAPSDSQFSFRRLTIDLTNNLYVIKKFTPKEGASTTEQVATLQLRGLLVESMAPAGHVVPFYFQPTLGGGDLEKQRTLASFADYRFRAPNALLLRAQYEQPLPKLSFLGLLFLADTGKVANTRGDIEFSHLRHSFATGLTIRAGNFPYLIVAYAWAGGEGNHTFVDLNTSAISSSGGAASLW